MQYRQVQQIFNTKLSRESRKYICSMHRLHIVFSAGVGAKSKVRPPDEICHMDTLEMNNVLLAIRTTTQTTAGCSSLCWALSQVCTSLDAALVFVFFCLSRSESGAPCVRGVHSSNTHCVAVYRSISTWFRSFFSEGIALSDNLRSSHIRR